MNFILPIGQTPIRCFQNFAYPLSIIFTDDRFLPWFHNHFIQIYCRKNYKDINVLRPELRIDFYNYKVPSSYPCLEHQYLSYDFITSNQDECLLVLKSYLTKGFYIFAAVDEFFIPHRKSFLKTHFDHDILICGFNEENLCFNVIGYTDTGVFAGTDVNYNYMVKALHSTYLNRNKNVHLIFYKPKECWEYRFDIKLCKGLIKDYLDGHLSRDISDLFDDYRPDCSAFGRDVYNYFYLYLKSVSINDMEVDFRTTRLIYEHKICMYQRLKFLEKNKYVDKLLQFSTEYHLILQTAIIINNLFLKFGITKDVKILHSISERMKVIENKEYQLLDNLLQHL